MQSRHIALNRLILIFLAATARVEGFGQRFIEIGTLFPNLHSQAYGVSSAGPPSVVGRASMQGGGWRAFRWTEATGMQNLGTFGGNYSQATATSFDGQVSAGHSQTAEDESRAFRWTPGSGMQNLGVLSGGKSSSATGVSSDGSVISGSSEIASGATRAFRWTAGAGMTDLGKLPFAANSFAAGVSPDGSIVVGESGTFSNKRAVRWTQAGIENLGTLGGNSGEAYDASQDGSIVVGRDLNGSNQYRGFVWREGEGMQALPTFGGGSGHAWSISADGSRIVGQASYQGEITRAAMWKGADIQDLNELYEDVIPMGWTLTFALSISESGRYIVGFGESPRLRDEAWLIDTVPEPATTTVLALGVILLIRRHRTK